jgi:hypothetical protein
MDAARTDEKAGATVGGYGQINRVMTTVHDAFDGHYWQLNELRARDVPGNADYYMMDADGELEILQKGWALHTPGATAPDEVIALPGTAIPEWIHDFAHHFETMVSADVGFLSSLARTMQAHGATWCQACDLFLLHQDGAPTALADRWIACAGGPGRLYEYLGRPPDPFLNIDATDCSACPPLHYADGAGVCHACPAGEVPVWGGCEPCPDGSIRVLMGGATTATPGASAAALTASPAARSAAPIPPRTPACPAWTIWWWTGRRRTRTARCR